MPTKRQQSSSPGDFVVLTSALTVRVRQARVGEQPSTGTVRYVRGQRFTPPADMPQDKLDRLVQLKAIAPDDGKPKRATTARDACRAAGAPEDPAKSPIVEFAPVPLPSDDAVSVQAKINEEAEKREAEAEKSSGESDAEKSSGESDAE
jgi:hypothetical protein